MAKCLGLFCLSALAPFTSQACTCLGFRVVLVAIGGGPQSRSGNDGRKAGGLKDLGPDRGEGARLSSHQCWNPFRATIGASSGSRVLGPGVGNSSGHRASLGSGPMPISGLRLKGSLAEPGFGPSRRLKPWEPEV